VIIQGEVMSVLNEIVAIQLPSVFDNYINTSDEKLDFIRDISKINILVGANNSGKSRFMRLLASQKNYDFFTKNLDILSVNQDIKNKLDEIFENMGRFNFKRIRSIQEESIEKMKRDLPLISFSRDNYASIRSTIGEWAAINDVQNIERLRNGYTNSDEDRKFLDRLRVLTREIGDILDSIQIVDEPLPRRIYIPILRGLRIIDDTRRDIYAIKTKEDYFKGIEDQPEIFTGLNLYEELSNLLLGNNKEREIIRQYQSFISKNLFEDKEISLIPHKKEQTVVVKIGQEKEQPIHRLGDGIQSAIILSFLAYTIKEPSIFFIEEPEVHMHPGLQRKILSFFDKATPHIYFLTTHSNHLLDITLDIAEMSVFTFRKSLNDSADDEKQANFVIEQVDSEVNSSLELLGVKNSSVFLVNATIWVEGITDRWYFRKMLQLYIRKLSNNGQIPMKIEEDTHFSFVEYSGGNITHWSFLDEEDHPIEVQRLCARAMVIVDQDGESKMIRKEKLKSFLEERFIELQCQEVENALPPTIIEKVVHEYEGTGNAKISSYEDYRYKSIGTFIEDELLNGKKKRRGRYAAKSGTIAQKVDFCKRALLHLDTITFDDLPAPTKEVIEQIYNFIVTQQR
jgi:AAA15 family ATPase/GTPase